MYLSIIIPLYNEELLIPDVLKELLRVKFPAFVEKTEIVIVDDHSTDQSYKTALQLAEGSPNVKVLQHSVNKGKGAAVRTGIQNSSGDVILIQDADLELSPADIPSLLHAMHELNVPFINGSRYLPGVLRPQAAFKRYFANKLFTLLTSVFIDVHLTDMACGYKLFRRELFDKLDLKESRFGFEAELIIKCAQIRKNWIAEVPVHYFPRNKGEGKKLNNLDGLRILRTILKYGLFHSSLAKTALETLFYIAVIIFSFFTFSTLHSNWINSDQAVHVLMANHLTLPEDLYFWGQDRLGSLVPLLANILVSWFRIKAITAVSIVMYAMLLCIFLIGKGWMKHRYSRMLFSVVVFIPFPLFLEQLRLAHPYTPQYFLYMSGLFFYFLFVKEPVLTRKYILWFLSIFTLFLSLWVSEFSIVFIACFAWIAVFQFLKVTFRERKLHIRMAYGRGQTILLLGLALLAIGINYGLIRYAKSQAIHTPDYEKTLTDWAHFSAGFTDYYHGFVNTILFRINNPYVSLHNWLAVAIVLYLFYAFIRRMSSGTFSMAQPREIFLLNSILGYLLLFASNWMALGNYHLWYFTYAYTSFAFYLMFAIDAQNFKARVLLSGMYSVALLLAGIQSYRMEKDVYRNDEKNFSLDRLKNIPEIKNCGIMGDYWTTYILSINDPDSVPSTTHDLIPSRNYRRVNDVFKKQHILLVGNHWMEKFPDSLIQFKCLLIKEGHPFRRDGMEFCLYKNPSPWP